MKRKASSLAAASAGSSLHRRVTKRRRASAHCSSSRVIFQPSRQPHTPSAMALSRSAAQATSSNSRQTCLALVQPSAARVCRQGFTGLMVLGTAARGARSGNGAKLTNAGTVRRSRARSRATTWRPSRPLSHCLGERAPGAGAVATLDALYLHVNRHRVAEARALLQQAAIGAVEAAAAAAASWTAGTPDRAVRADHQPRLDPAPLRHALAHGAQHARQDAEDRGDPPVNPNRRAGSCAVR